MCHVLWRLITCQKGVHNLWLTNFRLFECEACTSWLNNVHWMAYTLCSKPVLGLQTIKPNFVQFRTNVQIIGQILSGRYRFGRRFRLFACRRKTEKVGFFLSLKQTVLFAKVWPKTAYLFAAILFAYRQGAQVFTLSDGQQNILSQNLTSFNLMIQI